MPARYKILTLWPQPRRLATAVLGIWIKVKDTVWAKHQTNRKRGTIKLSS